MKKTTAYTRKRRIPAGFEMRPGHAWISAIERCRPFDAEPVVPGLQGTQANAIAAQLIVRQSLDSLLAHRTQPDNTDDFSHLAHAVDVAHIRALQIQPDDDNPLHKPLLSAKSALKSVRERRTRLGRWGLSAREREALQEAVSIYETILTSSSPEQMNESVEIRTDALDKGHFFTGSETQ